jgi:2-haloacid dehalogenase
VVEKEEGVTVDALLFDVFGTLVDWRTSLIDELTAFAAARGLTVPVAALVDDWRGAYVPSMDGVRRGSLPWTCLDALHRLSLDALLAREGLDLAEADRAHLARAWHRLRPWPDTVPGMTRLRARYPLGSLSNGNVALQVHLARFAGLPFDVLFSAEQFRRYKPDPEVYLGACAWLALPPARVMLVAAHNRDLDGARAVGMHTAFVARPTEYGPRQDRDLAPSAGVDVAASDLVELADRLGA